MPAVEWKNEYSLGIPEIDDDHKTLIRIFSDFTKAVEDGHGEDAVAATLESLTAYVSYHFRHEESFFLRADYPDYEAHRREHERLVNRLSEIYSRYHSGENRSTPEEVMTFLEYFLNVHVMTFDRKFGLYLSSNLLFL